MTSTSSLLLAIAAIAAIAAVADWVAVARRPSPVEYVAKPLVMLALIGVALSLHPDSGAQRAWFVVALALSLAGDVFLLPKPDLFVPGLASFLLGHVAYIVGFTQAAGSGGPVLPALVFGAFFVLVRQVVNRILVPLYRRDRALMAAVVVYMVVIEVMVLSSAFRGDGVAIAGAALFAASDTTLAFDRFDRHRRWAPLAVMVTYHLAQALLVLSLTSPW